MAAAVQEVPLTSHTNSRCWSHAATRSSCCCTGLLGWVVLVHPRAPKNVTQANLQAYGCNLTGDAALAEKLLMNQQQTPSHAPRLMALACPAAAAAAGRCWWW
jgi:hypothetical protein